MGDFDLVAELPFLHIRGSSIGTKRGASRDAPATMGVVCHKKHIEHIEGGVITVPSSWTFVSSW